MKLGENQENHAAPVTHVTGSLCTGLQGCEVIIVARRPATVESLNKAFA
jgi:hypothetical protein